ncbi:LytTR family DNA-binding domain-containing protein [Alcanivorax sp. 1008]|uniref:LytR/AlgR family response regulator transcription factor n=1 Tax=Alcanivorax sp. 1008 TaxID=2816853 RepID=UPI001D97D6C0|nr:LytTR family DNA-binding domain-containing protein [Alcanivorax sp. 1008]MCC1497407.1 response regulator transcription factor [Alcanivorax sp. 1008]MDF1628275.1 LytTR family DNA-binding domain-containing protein [Alcanivoracaceae bacterium]
MRVLVCDDEKLARDRLARLTEAVPDTEVVGEAANGREAVILAQSKRPDVVLLDIRMPDMDGIEAARHLLKLEHPPAVIFCTAYDEHALQAFKVQAVDYLLKPVSREDLATALGRVHGISRSRLDALEGEVDPQGAAQRRHISARTHRGIELVPVSEIRYFLADQKYVTVKYPDGEVLIDDTLKELEDEFGERFVRIHRNALVAVGWLEGMELATAGHYQVRLKGVEERLVVSRRHVAGLRKMMARL